MNDDKQNIEIRYIYLPQTFCVVDIDIGITHNLEGHFCVYLRPQAISEIN